MQSIDQDLRCQQGATFSERVTIIDGSIPTNLSDRTFQGQVRAKPGGILLATLICEKADQTSDPGGLYLKLDPVTTKRLPVLPSPEGYILESNFVYSVVAIYSNGSVDPVMSGKFIVQPQV